MPTTRVERTRKHPLSDTIQIVLIGMIRGCRSWGDMRQFAEMGAPEIREFLDLPNRVPRKDALRRVIPALDPATFRNGFVQWTNAMCGSTKGKLVAIEGKTVRRALREGDALGSLHLISASVKENAPTLGRYATDVKNNEITAIPEFVKLLSLQGTFVIGADKAKEYGARNGVPGERLLRVRVRRESGSGRFGWQIHIETSALARQSRRPSPQTRAFWRVSDGCSRISS